MAFLVIKERIKGELKKTLLLTGFSAAGVFVSIFLHNAFYALSVLTKNIIALGFLMEALHIFFFFATFLCLFGFLAGMVGCVVLLVKQKVGL